MKVMCTGGSEPLRFDFDHTAASIRTKSAIENCVVLVDVFLMLRGSHRGGTYEAAGAVDAELACCGAVQPRWLGKAEESV